MEVKPRPTMVSALSHENLENRTLLMVPKLYLWFSDSVVWTQCAHGGSHTWNFDLLVSTPRGQCWLLQLPASYVTLRATDCTVLLNDDVHRCSDKTVTFLFLCIMNTCICNCLCVLVCMCLNGGQSDFQLCASEGLHLDFCWLKSLPLTLGLAVSMSLLSIPAIIWSYSQGLGI